MKYQVWRSVLTTLTIVTVLSAFTTGCEQPEGYGGNASISGKIITEFYNDDYSALIRTAPAMDEQVFLLFGDNENVADKVESSANGSFNFSFLNPGKYKIYYESEDSTKLDGSDIPVMIDIELSSGEDLDLGELSQFEVLDFDDGAATIHGVIMLINYKNTSVYPNLEIKDTSFAQEHEVYLIYGAHKYYDERIRTGYNGYFESRNLIRGDYEIYTFSEDVAGGTEDIPKIKKVTITEEDQSIDLGVIYIEQL
ncbi:MAG: hypothetical protein K9G38_05805 [Bacteroidales bacterium]|nr:hypothetical protein [Bacteroidales bacterium]